MRGRQKCCYSIKKAVKSLYFWACVVYFGYVCLILEVNYCQDIFPNTPLPNTTNSSFFAFPQAQHQHHHHQSRLGRRLLDDPPIEQDDLVGGSSSEGYDYDYVIAWQCQSKGDTPLNREFIAASIIHVTNGVMFAMYWVPYFKKHPETPWWRRCLLLLPECLNIIEASLYIKSASLYGDSSRYCKDYTCALKIEEHNLESTASFLEMFASFGWFYSWYTTFPHGPGRGLTLWDPDFVAALGLIVPSIIYVVYNVQNRLYPENIPTNNLYLVADVIYWFDAVVYLLAALRDAECFWWLKAVPGCAKPSQDVGSIPQPLVSPSSLLAYDYTLPEQVGINEN